METKEDIYNFIKDNNLDGFTYCKLVNDLFNKVIESEDETKLRHRGRGLIKDLIEEIVPISIFVRIIYKIGLKLQVSWNGYESQSYDGSIRQIGLTVNNFHLPDNFFIEVTTAEHKKEFRVRQIISREGVCFAPKGIDDNNRNKIISRCVSYDGDEYIDEFFSILERIIYQKNLKNYHVNTVLIVRCELNNIYNNRDWNILENRVKKSVRDFRFLEIFIYDSATERFFILKSTDSRG